MNPQLIAEAMKVEIAKADDGLAIVAESKTNPFLVKVDGWVDLTKVADAALAVPMEMNVEFATGLVMKQSNGTGSPDLIRKVIRALNGEQVSFIYQRPTLIT